ncbi:hypothetical protein FGB62_299g09 [Gracilaria domingensis]|nr:hypothetical protein FGB62_299g09 [Gracilaria domingensis]
MDCVARGSGRALQRCAPERRGRKRAAIRDAVAAARRAMHAANNARKSVSVAAAAALSLTRGARSVTPPSRLSISQQVARVKTARAADAQRGRKSQAHSDLSTRAACRPPPRSISLLRVAARRRAGDKSSHNSRALRFWRAAAELRRVLASAEPGSRAACGTARRLAAAVVSCARRVFGRRLASQERPATLYGPPPAQRISDMRWCGGMEQVARRGDDGGTRGGDARARMASNARASRGAAAAAAPVAAAARAAAAAAARRRARRAPPARRRSSGAA